MHSNFVSRLPNEILAIIINEIALDIDIDSLSISALASCRLASHVLCSLATPLLFSSISLTDPNPDAGGTIFVKRATTLNDILASGNIATSIHSLSVAVYAETLDNPLSGAIMSAIFPCLPHIQKFSLHAKNHYLYFQWLSLDFAAAIQALCKSTNLTTLALYHIRDFPFKTIWTCPNLRCLRLRWSTLKFGNSTESSHLLHLDSLGVDSRGLNTLVSHASEDVSIAKCFTSLKNLHLKDIFLSHDRLRRGWYVMLLALQTLEKLELSVDQCLAGTEDMLDRLPFDLGRFPALRHVNIEQQGVYPNFLHRLTSLLSIQSSPSGIEVLETRTTWYDSKDGHGKYLFPSDAGWSALDKLLTSQKFVSLRKVVLCLDLLMVGTGRLPHILELERNLILPHVNNLLPSFRASNTQRTVEIRLHLML